MAEDNIKINKRFESVSGSTTFKNILEIFKMSKATVLDIGCGFGEHLYCFGKESVGITTKDEEVIFGASKKLNIVKGNAENINEISLNKNFDIIWANNLFEHLLSPHAFLIKLKKVSKGSPVLILGVPVVPKIYFLSRLKKFSGVLADSHINFFTNETLELTISRAGWKVLSIRPFLFKNKVVDSMFSKIAPHLYVVAYNNRNFVYSDKKIKEWKGEKQYEELFDIIKKHD